MQKKKRIGQMFFVLATCCTLNSHGRGEHCSPAKNHKVTFLLLALFTDEKRGKSHIRGVPPLIYLPLSPRGDQCEQSAQTVPL